MEREQGIIDKRVRNHGAGKHTLCHLCAKEFQLCSSFYHGQRLLLQNKFITMPVTPVETTQRFVELLVIIIVRVISAGLDMKHECGNIGAVICAGFFCREGVRF